LKPSGCNADGPGDWSRPARGAWIETLIKLSLGGRIFVAPRAGRVD